MENSQITNRLFIGVYPGGIVYADRMNEEDGDYKKLAFLSYSTLKLEFSGECPIDLQERIEKNAIKVIEKKGCPFAISSSQTVILGQ